MAQVSAAVPPSPAAMSRRAPLSNLPNAINSTYQSMSSNSMKRPRSQSAIQRDAGFGQPPPKKQAVEATISQQQQLRTPVRRSQSAIDATKPAVPRRPSVRSTRPAIGAPPAFVDVVQQQQQQLLQQQARKTSAPSRAAAEVVEHQGNSDVRAWQKHYRKAFPGYVFFFENISADVLTKAQKQITSLGASYEKFFSAKVTHLITNRTVPNDATQQSASTTARWNPRSANPALADQRAEARKGGRGADILLKAREYGMKIWATEKLDRVLNVLFDFQDDRPALTATNPRQVTQTYHANPVQNDLSHLLRNERLHGPTDRDPSVASKDLHFWKGPFIYVHDMFGTNRPIIMREYPKVQRREDGTWPQFRSVSGGKCPFIEESVHQRREKDRAGRERAEPVKEKAKAPETKKESSQEEHPKPDVKEIVQAQKPVTKEASEMGPRPATSKEKEPVEEHAKPITKAKETAEARPKAVESVASKERSPPKSRAYAGKGRRVLNEVNETDHRTNSRAIARPALEAASTKRGARPENTIAFTATNESTAQTARRCNVEPAASGLQPSNVTSAIRSAMISSHQDQPGQRAGTSKEIHALHRKVAGNVLMGNIPKAASLTRRATDSVAAKVPEAEVPKLLRRRTADGQSEEQKVREAQVLRKHPKPEPKPGYCENCREKFEDFEEHTLSRQHRKFALNNKNWADLDDLLVALRRPIKEQPRMRSSCAM